MTIAMFIFGLLMICSALGVVLATKPFTSALWLMGTFVLLAINYALLSADFLAVSQIMIYAGAIAVLIIFVVMLLGAGPSRPHGCSVYDSKLQSIKQFLSGVNFAEVARQILRVVIITVTVAIFFFCVATSYYIARGELPYKLPNIPLMGSVGEIGKVLFSKYSYAVKLLGVLILTVAVGVVVLIKDKRRPLPPGHGLKAKHEEVQ